MICKIQNNYIIICNPYNTETDKTIHKNIESIKKFVDRGQWMVCIYNMDVFIIP